MNQTNLEDINGLVISRLLTFAFTCSLLYSAYIFYLFFFDPLAKIPGPYVARFSNFWLLRVVRQWDLHKRLGPLHDKYGPVVRVGPNEVWFSDPALMKVIYGAGTGFPKSDFYRGAGSPVKPEEPLDLLTETDMDRYRLQRRLIGPIYAPSNVQKFEPMMDTKISQFMGKMKQLEGQVLDLAEWSMVIACEVMCYLTWSQDLGFTEFGNSRGMTKETEHAWKSFATGGVFPRLYVFGTLVKMKILGMESTIRTYLGRTPRESQQPYLFTKVLEYVQHRRSEHANGQRYSDFMEDLFDLQARRPEFLDHWIDGMSLTNIGGGHDTITLSLTSIISQICWLPGCQTKLQEELDLARKAGHLNDMPTYHQTQKLEYLNACILEAMRLQPIFSYPLPREVPANGLRVGDYFIPPGTTVGISPHILHHNQPTFGKDANQFNPSRWQNVSTQKSHEMHSSTMIWGGVNRICPGQFIAKQFLHKFVASLFLNFDVNVLSIEESTQMGHDFVEHSQFMMHREGIMFKLHQR